MPQRQTMFRHSQHQGDLLAGHLWIGGPPKTLAITEESSLTNRLENGCGLYNPRRRLAGHCLIALANTSMGFGELRHIRRCAGAL
jgi:hypothetical protein